MRLRKVCPQCSTVIHARRSVCECGHAFTLKREARITASSPAKRKRALESLEDTLRRQESNRTRMASMRASETQEQVQEYNNVSKIMTQCLILNIIKISLQK